MIWDPAVKTQFDLMISKIPVFLRPIAEKKVSQKAEALAVKEGMAQVSEKNMVDAFFAETPFGFHGPMKTDMDEFGIDYIKHGYER